MEERSTKKLGVTEEEISGYIKRAIPDIARKCNTDNLKVIQILKKLTI